MGTLLDKIAEEDTLYRAWRRVRANRGAPGVDAVTVSDFEAHLPRMLADLGQRLRDESYVPLGLRRTSIPKPDGGERALAIPTVLDRVAQRAFVDVLEPIIDPVFLPCSFAYRPGRGVDDAVERVLRYRGAGFDWMLDADVADFFPSVEHDRLMAQLRRHVPDPAVLRVIRLWLEAGALDAPGGDRSLLTRTADRVCTAVRTLLDEDGNDPRRPIGVSGGAFDDMPVGEEPEDAGHVLSGDRLRLLGREAARLAWDNRRLLVPLLAHKGLLVCGGAGLALGGAALVARHLYRSRPHTSLAPEEDRRRLGTPQGGPISPLLSNVYLHAFDEGMMRAGLRLVRYADDFVVCCPSEVRARHAWEIAASELDRLRLRLHPEKTRILSCRDPLRFLGHVLDDDGACPLPGAFPDAFPGGGDRDGDAAADVLRRGASAAAGGVRALGGAAGRALGRARSCFEERRG